tara:strand:+ start:1206 stop:1721 length:516 start_codon:yes stop_codon:yes gene_type:complete
MKSLSLFFKSLNITKWSLLTLTPILTVILNTQSALTGLSIIILIDMITGIRKSLFAKGIKLNPFNIVFWKGIESKGLRSTWRKTYEYGIGIIVFSVFESLVFKGQKINIFENIFSITEFAVITACVVEIYSVFENMEAVSGRNLLKKITSYLRDNELVAFMSRFLKKGAKK